MPKPEKILTKEEIKAIHNAVYVLDVENFKSSSKVLKSLLKRLKVWDPSNE